MGWSESLRPLGACALPTSGGLSKCYFKETILSLRSLLPSVKAIILSIVLDTFILKKKTKLSSLYEFPMTAQLIAFVPFYKRGNRNESLD